VAWRARAKIGHFYFAPTHANRRAPASRQFGYTGIYPHPRAWIPAQSFGEAVYGRSGIAPGGNE
jgi:hypothetical protein